VGNVYMIVGGAPEVNKTHANDVARGLLLHNRCNLLYNPFLTFV